NATPLPADCNDETPGLVHFAAIRCGGMRFKAACMSFMCPSPDRPAVCSRRFQWRRVALAAKSVRMMAMIDRWRLAAVVCVAGIAVGTVIASANDVARWDGDARSSVRLIAGTPAPGATHVRAGVELRLMRGWHTYWRYPGDSGVPPQFSFAGSRNVKHVDVLW